MGLVAIGTQLKLAFGDNDKLMVVMLSGFWSRFCCFCLHHVVLGLAVVSIPSWRLLICCFISVLNNYIPPQWRQPLLSCLLKMLFIKSWRVVLFDVMLAGHRVLLSRLFVLSEAYHEFGPWHLTVAPTVGSIYGWQLPYNEVALTHYLLIHTGTWLKPLDILSMQVA